MALLLLQDMPFPYLRCTARPSVKIWSEHLRPLNTFLRRTSACPTRPLSPGGIWRSEHRSRLSAKKKEEKNGALRPTTALCTSTFWVLHQPQHYTSSPSYTSTSTPILGHQPIWPRAFLAPHHAVLKPLKTVSKTSLQLISRFGKRKSPPSRQYLYFLLVIINPSIGTETLQVRCYKINYENK